MHMKPLNDRVIVRRLDDENITSGGIVLPDTVQDKSIEGEVVALGMGKQGQHGEIIAASVSIGDKVLFEHEQGFEIMFEGERLVALREDDIICVVLD